MNQDSSSWETNTARWRNATALFEPDENKSNTPTSSCPSRPPAPHLSAPTAVNPATQSSLIFDHFTSANAWIGKSRPLQQREPGVYEGLPRLTEPYTEPVSALSSRHTRPPYERHTPAPGGDSHYYDPHRLATTSPRETSVASWRSLHHHDDRRMSSSHTTDAPLTLHIPQANKDLPRITPTSNTLPSDTQSHSNYPSSITSTSLPSFASLKGQTYRGDDADEPEIAPMSSRLSCYLCTKLRPLVKEVTDAVIELDDSVQTYCSRTIVTRPPEVPNDSPIRAVHWILERLRNAKLDIKDAARRAQTGAYYAHQATGSSDASRNLSPLNPLKRPAERWERDDLPGPKRPRSGASSEQQYQHQPGFALREDRRGSIDFASQSRLGFSPPPTESLPGSAHPRQTSPPFANRANLSLPSPSSLAYPLSAAPSLPPHTAPSVGSPATSYQAAPSIHTASTSSATSAHISDLQHQVTLKSLALQTLQSEYASLLQKLQRERVKSQAIEKKTSVADQEVNDLTGKNEDLSDQVKSLASQLEESEKKRELERSEAQREKDQWGRMLEMSGRLHAKVDNERQRLLEEKTSLARRIAVYEGGFAPATSPKEEDVVDTASEHPGPRGLTISDTAERLLTKDSSNAPAPAEQPGGFSAEHENDEATGLKREVVQLHARIDALRFTLQQVKHNNVAWEEQARNFVHQSHSLGEDIDRVLKDDQAKMTLRLSPSGRSTPSRQKPKWSPTQTTSTVPSAYHSDVHKSTSSSSSKPSATLQVMIGGKMTKADIATVGRATSPSKPEELGFAVPPTTSSPEELIRALGPVPSKTASVQLGTTSLLHQPDRKREVAKVERHLSDLRAGVERPTSPTRSYHSSPGDVFDEGSSVSAEGYTSEPEASRMMMGHQSLPPLRLNTAGMPTLGQFRDSGYGSASIMLPPARPAHRDMPPRTHV